MSPAAQAAVERIAALPGAGRLSRDDVADIIACAERPDVELVFSLLVADYQAQGTSPLREWWQLVLQVVVDVGEELLPLVGPIESVIGALS